MTTELIAMARAGAGRHLGQQIDAYDGAQPGDPAWAAQALITALGTEAAPLRLTRGNDAMDAIRGSLERGLAGIARWKPAARKAGSGA